MSTQRVKYGFTVVELVTVVFILAALFALLLPALVVSAADARANVCQNKLRQLGLALENYESGRREYPRASWTHTTFHAADCRPADASGGKGTTAYSWIVSVIPQLDNIDLYRDISEESKRFTIATGPFDPNNMSKKDPSRHASCVTLPDVICPDWKGDKYTNVNQTIDAGRAANPGEPANQGAPEYATVDSAIPGAGAASFKGHVAPTCYKPVVGTHMEKGMPVENGGMILSGRSGLTHSAFSDGTSKTIMLCESKECSYASWYDGTLNWLVGNDPNAASPGTDSKPPWFNAVPALNKGGNSVPYLKKANSANLPQNDVWWGPSSDHAGGVVYHVFVDNSTLGITGACDPTTYLGLITRAGEEPIDDTNIK
jgi:type II secretory pathway pseudopilin PulG